MQYKSIHAYETILEKPILIKLDSFLQPIETYFQT